MPGQGRAAAAAPGQGRAAAVPGRGSAPAGRGSTGAVYGAGAPDAVRPDQAPSRSDATRTVFGTVEHEPGPLPIAEVVPVRRRLSVAIAGFAGLLGLGLILGAQTSGPDARLPFAVVVGGVQLLFILAWTMAMRPPALKTVAGVGVLVAVAADFAAVVPVTATLSPLVSVAFGGVIAVVLGQLVQRVDRIRITDSLGTTLLIVLGVVAFAMLIVLTRRPAGTQGVTVCLAATGVALLVARLVDAVLARPRIAPQVPRGAAGVVLGAMLGTLTGAVLGSLLVVPFNPARGAVLGLAAATAATLADLAVNFTEASRNRAADTPTFWMARHMQAPLGSFALAAPVAYGLTLLVLP